MNLIKTEVYPLPDFEYFSEELKWDVESWDDVINILKEFDAFDGMLGFPDSTHYEVK
jgi:hypothetical protein